MTDATRTSPLRTVLALGAVLLSCLAGAGEARAASSLDAVVDPATPGTPAAPAPVTVSVGASVTAPRGSLAPALARLAISLPDGFKTALDAVAVCADPSFGDRGSAGCPVSSRLGTGHAAFVYVAGALRFAGTTEELVVFRGPPAGTAPGPAGGDTVFLFLRVTQPAPLQVALPGTLVERAAPAGPLLTFDLGQIARMDGGTSVVVTRAALNLTRGFAAGACPAGRWAFTARLEYVGGGVEEPAADAPCNTTSDTVPPILRVAARGGPRALGARFAVRLSEAATVRATLERRSDAGWVTLRRATFYVPAGSSVVRIRRASGRALAPGHYRARLRAVDGAGLRSAKRTVSLTLQ